MYRDKRILGLIPARGGSKGLPGKNIRPLAGKPLLAWTIEAARGSRYLDRIVLSSDDEAILACGRQWGAETPFVRPRHLAADDAPGMAVVLHALEQLPGYDWVVLLQPTSPLRLAQDIDAAIERLHDCGAPACVSVTAVDKSPYWMYFLSGEHCLQPVLPLSERAVNRQCLPDIYVLNGAVYVAEIAGLQASGSFLGGGAVAYVMPASRSVDIDTERDFALAEAELAAVREGAAD